MLKTGKWQEGSRSEICLLSAWFFCKAETALKNKVCQLEKKDLTKGGCCVANSFFSCSSLFCLPRDFFPYLRPWAPTGQAPRLSILISSHSSYVCTSPRGPDSAFSCPLGPGCYYYSPVCLPCDDLCLVLPSLFVYIQAGRTGLLVTLGTLNLDTVP